MAKVETAISGLRPLYLFDQLVVGSHNQFAVGACQEVLRAPGETYNPLFIYGPPGVGKTHLMQAVAHQIFQQNPAFKIRYISAERFMSEMLTAISEDRVLEVRRAYSILDLLILDDVQYLTESKIAQEELFHVFNNLHQSNRQVILASDRPPNQLTNLNTNIRTRLEWGLSTDVKVPDEATRLQILQRKQQQMPGLTMDNSMLVYVSRALRNNVRELEGFLKRLHAYVTLSHQALSLELVKAVVREILPEGAPDPMIDLAQVSVAVAAAVAAPIPVPIPIPVATPIPPPVATPTPLPIVSPVANGNGAGYHKPPKIPSPDELMGAPSPVKSEPPPLAPAVPAKPAAVDSLSFEIMLEGIDQPAAAVNLPSMPAAPELKAVAPPVVAPPAAPPEDLDDNALGHKDIGAVFFYPTGAEEALESVHRKFLDVIKKHKLKFRLKRIHSEPYAYKGKINYSSFVDICKQNKVPVAIVIGPPSESGAPHQDFYDLLTVTLDVQGVSLQLVNWGEINKDYRYLNLALDIALVRSR